MALINSFSKFLSPMTSPNSRYILSLNAGSSSLKISLFSLLPKDSEVHEGNILLEPVSLVLTSSISDISSSPARFTFELADSAFSPTSNTDDSTDAITDHASAFHHFIRTLESSTSIDHQSIVYICHRVVHGGDYTQPIIITKSSYNHIEKLSDLAPLFAHFSLVRLLL